MGAVVECLPSPQQAEELAVLSLNKLPLGFRFRPTDEELVDFYLRMKINGNGDEVWVIREVDVCKFEPWDLPDLSIVRNKDPEWFFFCPMDRKYPNGSRLNRATTNGYWKATGKDRKIKSGATLIGMKKTLVFYAGRAPKGQRTHWIMHEYRPTLKELDGTNPGQNPYVLCRLFKKQDESLASSNCGEAEQTTSTPTTANYSPEEIQSDLNLVPLSSSLATEDERHLAAIPENSEEAMSHVITTADCYSDACNASDAQHQSLEVPAAEEDQLLNLDIFDSPRFELEPWDDKLFSPAHAHFPPEFGHQANNELIQYGTNGTDVSDFFDSCVNWDEFSSEASISLELSPNIFKIPENGSCSNSDVEMANMMNLLASHDYPEGVTLQNSDVGLFQNNSQMTLSNDFSMGQMPTVVNEYEQMWNSDTVVDGGTGIGIRSRQRQNEQPDMNQVMQAQGSAPRRIRLGGFVARSLVSETTEDGSCASEYEQSRILDTVVLGDDTGIRIRRRQRRNEEPNMNPVMQAQGSALRRIRLGGFVKHSLVSEETTKDESLQETEASENHAAAESASVLEKTSPMSAREICEQHVTTAESNSGSKNFHHLQTFSLLGFPISLPSPSTMASETPQNGAASETASPVVSFVAFKPQLFVEAPKANDAVVFYKNAFAAEEVSRSLNAKRKADQELPLVLSAELKIAGASFLVADAVDDSAKLVKSGGNGVVFCLESENIEAAIAKAVSAGAVAEGEVAECEGACGGGRVGKVTDPYGYVWQFCTPAKKAVGDVEA